MMNDERYLPGELTDVILKLLDTINARLDDPEQLARESTADLMILTSLATQALQLLRAEGDMADPPERPEQTEQASLH